MKNTSRQIIVVIEELATFGGGKGEYVSIGSLKRVESREKEAPSEVGVSSKTTSLLTRSSQVLGL